MLRSLALSLAFAGAASVALAQGAPAPSEASSETCLKSAFDLAKAAEAKKLPEAKLDSLEEMLAKLESLCDAKKFAEAAGVAKDIKTAIEAK